MMQQSASGIFLIVFFTTLFTLALCEELFHLRNREDNVLYRNMQDKNMVTSMEKAEEVLKRYGYLRCGSSRKRFSSSHRHKDRNRRCSNEEIRHAVRRYQNTYNMSPTGTLDSATLKLMSESRCGNPDDERHRARPMIRPKKRHWKKGHNYQHLGRHKRDIQYTESLRAQSVDNSIPFPAWTSKNLKVGTNTKDQLGLWAKKTIPLHEMILGDRKFSSEDPFPPGTSVTRRKKWLERYLKDVESGRLEQKLIENHEKNQHRRRRKRSLSPGAEGQSFVNEVVTWRLVGSAYSNQLTVNTQRAALALAFRMWGEVIPIVFQEDIRSPVDDVDVLIAFGKGEHLNCPNHFDGLGGQLSHAVKLSTSAEIHVDDDEQLTVGSEQGTNLVKVAVHEVGHALGLFHTSRNDSIMYAIYSKVIPNSNFELGWEDRKLVQDVYGICKVRFNTVFDWVRRRSDGQLIYNTYFFRDNRYWMYENRYNRTRYGDPLTIRPEWKGIPDNADGYAHVWTYTQDSAYFFKGNRFWLYNSREDQVAHGYPKNISSEFRAIEGTNYPNVPGHLDSVFFDKRDGNLYFFKGSMVYAYDVALGQNGCCLQGFPKHIHKEFPSISKESSLPSHLDAVYYSYTDRSMYFFKGVHFWQNVAFNALDRRRTNKVKGPWLIASKWYDICDVEA